MSNVLDDLTSRFKSFGDTLAGGFDKSFTTIAEGFDNVLNVKVKAGARHQAYLDDFGSSKTQDTLSSADNETARQRAELILQKLPAAYYEQTTDPLGCELRQMGDETKQDDIDGIVDGLAAAVEVVSVKLARHVLKNQDKLLAGITNVTEVEDDLKAANVICHGTRSQLKVAAEEVQRQIKIITCTRKKQAYMEVLEVLCKVKRVQDLQHELRKVDDVGDFAEAVLLCIDGFQAVESLAAFKVAPELQVTVQRQYFNTQQRIKVALMNECNFFTSDGYSKLLEAYLLQGLSGTDLAFKILTCFEECIDDTATRLVRSMVLAQAAFSADSVNSPGTGRQHNSIERMSCIGLDDCNYDDLCKQLPPDAMQRCLGKLLEIVFELLCSYHLMARWHEAGIQQQKQVAAAAAAAVEAAAQHRSNSDNGSRSNTGSTTVNGSVEQQQEQSMLPSQEQLDQVQAATKSMLQAVAQKLADSRLEIMQLAISKVHPLLAHLGKCAGEEFNKVVHVCMQLVGIGEAFAGAPMPLQQTIWCTVSSSVEGHHRTNMDALKLSLALEGWQPISTDISISSMKLTLSTIASVQPTADHPGGAKYFDAYVQAGNPFKTISHLRAVGGQSTTLNSTGQLGQAVSRHPAAAQPEAQPAAPNAAAATWVATKSSVLVLQCLNSYAALLAPLPARQAVLWAAMTEMFDNFFLACFILFSGVSLEALVWQEDLLPHRLRSALLRITTSKGCKYKAQVEELQRTKPEASAEAAPSSSLLDFGFMTSSSTPIMSNGPSKLDAFTKRFKETMVDLMNTDLTQPAPSSSNSMHSSGSYHPGPQQQQLPGPQQPAQRPTAAQPGGTGAVQVAEAAGSSNNRAPAQQPAQQPQQRGPVGRQFGLKERVVAIESLTAIADAMKAARPGLLNQLGAGMAKEVDSYFARTVDTTQDLRDAIYRGGAKQLLMGVVDLDHGTAAQIASCNYFVKEPATAYQPWVEALLKQYRNYQEFVRLSGLPPEVQQNLWEAAVKLGCDAMLLGFSRIQHCSLPGRASMSLDLSAVQKGLRVLAPASAMGSFRVVDNYVKAFYIPWDDLARWSQVHMAEYGKAKILMLIETMAEAHGIRKAAKSALVDKLNTELAEFA